MTAGIGLTRLSSCCAALAVVALGTSAFAVPRGELRPVNNGLHRTVDAPVIAGASIVGNQISISGGPVNVELELLTSEWGSSAGDNLGACQLTIESSSYLGINASPINPAANLDPLGNMMGAGNPTTRAQGGFIVQSVCSGNGRDCTTGGPNPACAGPEGFCIPHPRWVIVGCGPLPVLALVTANYEYGAVCQSGSVPNVPAANAAANGYLGTLIVNVPSNANSTYTINMINDPNFSFFNNENGVLIPNAQLVPGQIRIITGSCCTNLGPGGTCTDNQTQGQCNALPTSNSRVYRPGVTCAQEECPACTNDAQCNDQNACTSEVCTAFECIYTNLYNTATQCCNPGNGATTTIDDGDACTGDVCNPATGGVAHNPLTGTACDDALDCTTDDVCTDGACAGTDVNTLTCTTDADCVAQAGLGTCGTAVAGFCECSEETPLCVLYVANGGHVDDNCYDAGSTVTATLSIGAGSQSVVGGQFLITYDNTCLDFVGIGPCAGDMIFTNVIQTSVNEAAGTIFYAVTSNPATAAAEGSTGPYDLGCISFIKSADCDECNICLGDVNPQNTILTNDEGNRVPIDSCVCSKDIRTAGEITLNTPPGASVNADCGQPYATVGWATPSATDTCDGTLEVDCQAQSVGGGPIGNLINNGGVFPQGTNFFTCTATNTCGDMVTNVWTVQVSDNQTLDVEVHLQPVINNTGIFNRAITFELYNDCVSDPVEECAVMQFQGPFNFPGHAHGTLKVDKGNFLCMTARDNLHTLRSIVTGDDLACVNNHWTAIFKGDPIQGGNWLIGGNLDAKKEGATYGDINTINILDFGMFMAELAAGASYEPNGDTDCNTASPHGDINADGAVDNLDYAFLVDNFLKNSKGLCCPAPTPDANGIAEANPITEVTVKELRRMGYGAATVADLNKDGKVNLDDMAAYMQGVKPVQVKPVREEKGRGTR